MITSPAIQNIYCIGRNYVEHIAEMNQKQDEEILVFLKPNSAITLTGTPIRLPTFSSLVHYEAELVLLMAKMPPASSSLYKPLRYIEAYAVGIDLTARDIQNKAITAGLPWLKCKGFKQSALLSSWVPSHKVAQANQLTFTLYCNGQLKQTGDITKMIHPLEKIICHLHHIYGLKEGDIIFTGTPKGVGSVHPKDHFQLNLFDKGKTLIEASFDIA